VALLDIEGELLREAVAVLAFPDHTLALMCDVSDAGAVNAAIAAVARRFGRLDAWSTTPASRCSRRRSRRRKPTGNRILAVNLTGPFLCTRAATPLMREHGGGAVVNITSISSLRASTLRVAYGTSKA
jgi:NAD(P)-dependent dehydrogenase (short-subunit alcohol dehydrogenase family)